MAKNGNDSCQLMTKQHVLHLHSEILVVVVVYSLSRVQLFWDPMHCSPPGSPVHGISQARALQWVAVSFPGDLPNPGIEPKSPALQADSLPTELQGGPIFHESQFSKPPCTLHSVCVCMCVCVCVYVFVCMLSCVWLFATPWTIAHQAPLTMEFSRQEY